MTHGYTLRYLDGTNKIAAIKLVRELTGLGLAAAKDAVEAQHVILRGLERERAEQLVARFAAEQARVELIEEAEVLHAFDPKHPARADQPLERLRWFGLELAWERGRIGEWQRERSERVASIASRDRWIAEQRQEWAAQRLAMAARELDIVEQLSAREPALEQQLRSREGFAEAASVYADWLQQQGDPRGSLIALGLACEAQPARRWQLEPAFAAALIEHRSHLFGLVGDPTPYVELEWSAGLVVGISMFRYAARDSSRPRESWPRGDVELLTNLLALPICACLRSLRTDSGLLSAPEFWSMLHACDPAQLAGLRELVLAPRYGFRPMSIDWTRFTGLERLELHGSDAPDIHVPGLRELSMRPRQFALVAEVLGRSSLEHLQVLTIVLTDRYGDLTDLHDGSAMAELLATPIVSSLRCLRFESSTPLDHNESRWLTQALVSAPGLANVAEIDVRQAGIGFAEQALLRAAKEQMPNLLID